jgi:hypothetical protein
MNKSDSNLILLISTAKNIKIRMLTAAPFFIVLLICYSIIPPSSYINYTLFVILTILFTCWVYAAQGYTFIKIYTDRVEFYYPYYFKKRIVFNFDEIKAIDLRPPQIPKAYPSIEIFFKSDKGNVHCVHLMDDKKFKAFSKALESVAPFKIYNKKH